MTDERPDERSSQREDRWQVFAETIAAFRIALLFFIVVGLVSALAQPLGPHAAGGVASVTAMAVTIFLERGGRGDPAPGRLGARTAGWAALSGVAFSFWAGAALQLARRHSDYVARTLDEYASHLAELLRVDEPLWIPIVLLTVAVAPAYTEERVFRGLLREQLAGWSPLYRVLLIALLFAGIHVSPTSVVPILVIALFWTWLADRTGGWLAPAITHGAFNATSAVVMSRLEETAKLGQGALLAVMLVGFAVGAGTILLAGRASERVPGDSD
jgi:membrane protease YdiL (CAAX protease family)